ncbi:MAG TPA: EscU/YscU/HrcU family type III secretion system export apparatus switch protein [Spirochaetia bacterium]|nr:EscU/YscU/HrcU family type III secretion system export apparatus switch protein [Spirochaetales bacterium]HRY80810.1 EscU/YscU/HrcU family type III secretion system export apparatus switch protein [Spirochaetia bacterium]
MLDEESPRIRPILAGRTKKAVALRYDDSLPAPFLVAKGAGASAERIRDLAEELGIPVLADEALAGFLFPLDPGDMVPEAYWEIVARVYVFIAKLEGI